MIRSDNLSLRFNLNMFTIRASHIETAEINAGLDRVFDFFTDIKNFIDLMPSIESIHQDNNNISHWKIRADIPFIGSFVEKFAVRPIENTEERIEWLPADGEKFNLMRYGADFMPKTKNKTFVQFSQNIELRRNSATDLHLLAGFAGESMISNEMTRRVAEMLNTFINQASRRLES